MKATLPLAGKTVLVTRARAQASELAKQLRKKGATVIEFPTIEILPSARPDRIDREIRRISGYDWVVFTSANGVRFFFERMKSLGRTRQIFSGVRIAVIGDSTAEALRKEGLQADLIPKKFTSVELFRALKPQARGKKILLARADIAPPDLRKNLEKEGAEVVELETYRTRRPRVFTKTPPRGFSERGGHKGLSLQDLFQKTKIDCITFTSSSTVENFFVSLPPRFRNKISARLISIGPVTSRTIREWGHRPYREAKVQTLEGLVDAICNGSKEIS